MENQTISQNRPISITFLCVLISLSLIFGLSGIWESAQAGVDSYFIYLILTWIFSFIFVIGFWFMKKWSIIFFLITSTLSQGYLIGIQSWNISYLIMPSLIMLIGLMNFKKMS